MEIREKNKIKVEDLVKGYEKDDVTDKVVAFDRNLDVRPEYQREFVYDDKDQKAVIATVLKKYPLNVMYWAKIGDKKWEVMDGQQRTLSICGFVNGDFSINVNGKPRMFANLEEDLKKRIMEYELAIYECEGTPSEILEWFKVINIAGKPLTPQELRNAAYHGKWVSSAKTYFSKPQPPALQMGDGYISGTVNRQELLEQAIDWARIQEGIPSVDDYMGIHQHDENAKLLWENYQKTIDWARNVFPTARKKLTDNQNWGELKKLYGNKPWDSGKLEEQIKKLLMDDEVTNQKGIYEYVLSGNEKYLSLRAFSRPQAWKAYEKQKGICPYCGKHFDFDQMEADHIRPWSEGGHTTDDNCQMLCKADNLKKSNHFIG